MDLQNFTIIPSGTLQVGPTALSTITNYQISCNVIDSHHGTFISGYYGDMKYLLTLVTGQDLTDFTTMAFKWIIGRKHGIN